MVDYLGTNEIETPEVVAERIRGAIQHTSPERLLPASDCGLKYLDRDVAYAKLLALVEGTRLVRRELGNDDTVRGEGVGRSTIGWARDRQQPHGRNR